MNDDNKTTKSVVIAIAVIIGVLIVISLAIKMSDTKADDVALNNTKNDLMQGTKDVIEGAKDGAMSIGDDVADGVTNVTNGIMDFFDINNTDNVTITDNMKTNTSDKFKETKTYGELTFSDASLIGKNTGADFKFKVSNYTESDFEKRDVLVKFIDKQGNELGSATINIPKTMAKSDRIVSEMIMADIANAYDYLVEYE